MPDIQLHLSGRRTGRSTEMINWLLEGEPNEKRVIVSFSSVEAERMYKKARKLCETVEDWQFISYRSNSQKLAGRKISEVGIDNLEFLLSSYFSGIAAPITRVTGTLAQDHKFGHQPGFVVDLDTESVFTDIYD